MSGFLTVICRNALIFNNGLLLAAIVPEPNSDEEQASKVVSRGRLRGLNMTDQKLHSLSENQLRALYNSAPAYLKELLDRKRVLEEGIVWEMSIPQRAAPKTF